jgi:hypothetical protein
MGKAILASDLDQIGEVLPPSLKVSALPTGGPQARTPELAVLTEPASVDQLVRGIKMLVDRPAWRAALGANARSRAPLHVEPPRRGDSRTPARGGASPEPVGKAGASICALR